MAAAGASTTPPTASPTGADNRLGTATETAPPGASSSWGTYTRSAAPPPQPAPPPPPAPAPDPAPRSPYPGPGPDWGAYNQYPPPQVTGEGRPWTIAGFVCGLLAILVAPIILGPLGITFGFIGSSKGDPRGRWVGIGSIVTTILGIVIAVIVLDAVKKT